MWKTSGGRGAGCFFALFWSALTLGFDGGIAYFACMNLRSYSFPETLGTVTVSQVDAKPDDDGTSYRPHVEYDYQVAGQPHHGTVRRYGEMGVSGLGARKSVQLILNRYPVGRQVPVFYDPHAPAVAVLERGLDGMELFLAMFLTPFNMVMLAIWAGVFTTKSTETEDSNEDMLIRETETGYEVATSRTHPLVAFGLGLGCGAFVLIFVIAFTAGFHPSLSTMTTVWSLLIAFAFLCSTGAMRNTTYFVDQANQQLSISGRWFRTDEVIPSSSIASITAKESLVQSSDSPVSYGLLVRHVDAAGVDQLTTIGSGWEHDQAERLALRLRTDLHLLEKGDAADMEPA